MDIRYARLGAAHIAFRVFGDGPMDILLMLGEYLPVDSIDEEPRYAKCLRRLSSLGRVIAFNRRGVGLSDPYEGEPTHQQNVDDAIAVLDHLGTPRAVVFGWNTSGAAAMRLAADHPDRVSALILTNTFARALWADDYPHGFPPEGFASTAEQTLDTELSDNAFLKAFAPSVADDQRFRTWWEQAGHRGATPFRAGQLWQLLGASDEREALGRITVPTLVIYRNNRAIPVELCRYIADHIDGAKYVELPGQDLIWWIGDADAVLDEVETFVSGKGAALRPQRKLATVLFFDVVGSTGRAAELGDRRWRELLETYIELARREVDRGGGQLVSTSGDGVLATFDMPADAVRSARRIAEGVGALGIDICAGVHTGEIEILGEDVAGIGVHIAARVMGAAAPGEVLVSRTVCDLVTGSGLAFEDRGEHELRGVPGAWNLYAVTV